MNLSECGAKEPVEIERDKPWLCYFCEGNGWIWADVKKRTCPHCHGSGIEPEEDEDEDGDE